MTEELVKTRALPCGHATGKAAGMISTWPLAPVLTGKVTFLDQELQLTRPQPDCLNAGEVRHVDRRMYSTIQEALSSGLLEETSAPQENFWVRPVELFWKDASEGRRGAAGVQT